MYQLRCELGGKCTIMQVPKCRNPVQRILIQSELLYKLNLTYMNREQSGHGFCAADELVGLLIWAVERFGFFPHNARAV